MRAEAAGGEAGERAHDAEVGFLGEVVGDVLSAEVGEEAPHVFLGGLDEVGEGSAVASPCFEGECGDGIIGRFVRCAGVHTRKNTRLRAGCGDATYIDSST